MTPSNPFFDTVELSLKKAKPLDHVKKAQKEAQVAKMVAVVNLEATLDSITTSTLEVINCDAAVLYVCDSALRCLSPPVTKGVHHPERASGYTDIPNSLVYEMLQRSGPYIVESVERDRRFEGSRFAKDEQIKSCLAIPLHAADQKVGVLFVNYRARHSFTADELTSAELFANKAAAAIRNAQLFMEESRRLYEQEKLGELSKGLLSSASLDEILEFVTSLAADLMDADSSDIIVRGRNQALVFTAAAGWEMMSPTPCKLNRDHWSYVDYAMRSGEPVTILDYTQERRFGVPREILASGFRSALIVPISLGNEVIGTMSVHTKASRHFTQAEITLLSIVTNQAAIAIKNAHEYESIKRQGASINALYQAGKAITACMELGRKQILDRIVEQAVECLTAGKGPTIAFGTIQLYDEATGELHFESTCCSRDYPEVRARLGEIRPIKQRITTGEPIGISGRTVLAKAPQIVDDVSKDPDYVQFDPFVRSALAVPLLDKEKVIGVLGMESNQPEAFDEDDQDTLLGLAELAVIAIRNAQQYDDLRRTRTLAEARTALAWMGMTSSAWRHTVHGHAITINDLVELATSALDNRSLPEVSRKLAQISDMALLIQQHPITAPLTSEESVRSVLVNALLRERFRQLWEHGSYKSVTLRLDFELPGTSAVRANPDWLIRALDVLVDNAIEAMEDIKGSVLTVGSRRDNKFVHIEISDTGKGIPAGVRKKLLQQRIEHFGDSKALGLGLLMARLIVQVYGGDISCQSTGPSGTTMVISLPFEAESVSGN